LHKYVECIYLDTAGEPSIWGVSVMIAVG